MMKGLIGKKIGMTQVYNESGKIVPVTVVEAGPCVVTALRTQERDGYSAVQLGFGSKKAKNVPKAQQGQYEKAGISELPAIVKEFRLSADSDLELGAIVTAELLKDVKYVDVTGKNKGRGFQGVVKRHNFGGGRASHGGDWERKPGSIGMCEFPGRVYKGRKMPGQMGNKQVTTQGLEIVAVRPADNVILIKGSVPGSKGGTVFINIAKKK
jgi:large subunit ribosomal protein L3